MEAILCKNNQPYRSEIYSLFSDNIHLYYLVCKLQSYILRLKLPMQHNNHVFLENTICFNAKRLLVIFE